MNLRQPFLTKRPLIYLITDRRALRPKPDSIDQFSHEQTQLELIAAAAQTVQAQQAGQLLVQIREKDLPARQLVEFTRAAIVRARPFGAQILVNDRLDVALAAQADGVHLRVNSLSAANVRNAAPNLLISVSTHSLAEAKTAEQGDADFIVCGPVYDTPSKRGYGAPLGLAALREICQTTRLPVLALGGITTAHFAELAAHGAAGIAAIRLFTETLTLPATIAKCKAAHFHQGRAEPGQAGTQSDAK